MEEKYKEKVSKYIPLANEIKLLWGLKKTKIQPVIIGSLGASTNRMQRELKSLQRKAIEESVKIIRYILNVN